MVERRAVPVAERFLSQPVCICIGRERSINVRIPVIEKKEETMDHTVAQNHYSKTRVCRRCGRKLINDISKERGMGTVCYNKWLIEHSRKKLFSPSLQKNRKNV